VFPVDKTVEIIAHTTSDRCNWRRTLWTPLFAKEAARQTEIQTTVDKNMHIYNTNSEHTKNSKEYLRKILIIFMPLNQHFISYFVWNFHSNWLLSVRVMQENESGCFFSEHSVYWSQYQYAFRKIFISRWKQRPVHCLVYFSHIVFVWFEINNISLQFYCGCVSRRAPAYTACGSKIMNLSSSSPRFVLAKTCQA